VSEEAFDPKEQYGYMVHVMPSQFSEQAVEEAKDLLRYMHINEFVPKEYWDQIKWIVLEPDPNRPGEHKYGTVAWKIGPIK